MLSELYTAEEMTLLSPMSNEDCSSDTSTHSDETSVSLCSEATASNPQQPTDDAPELTEPQTQAKVRVT